MDVAHSFNAQIADRASWQLGGAHPIPPDHHPGHVVRFRDLQPYGVLKCLILIGGRRGVLAEHLGAVGHFDREVNLFGPLMEVPEQQVVGLTVLAEKSMPVGQFKPGEVDLLPARTQQ